MCDEREFVVVVIVTDSCDGGNEREIEINPKAFPLVRSVRFYRLAGFNFPLCSA